MIVHRRWKWIVLLVALLTLSSSVFAEIVGAGTPNNPYREKEGSIGVTESCEVRVLAIASSGGSTGSWVGGEEDIIIFGGYGTGQDPFRLPGSQKGLFCTAPAHSSNDIKIMYLDPATGNWQDTPLEATRRGGSDLTRSTAGPVQQAIAFAVIGDFGSGNTNEKAVSELVEGWNPQFVITVGDNNYATPDDGSSAETYEENVGKYYGTFVQERRFWPTLGNHDYSNYNDNGQGYLNYFSYLPGNQRYYDVDYGLVHLFALDSNQNLKEQKLKEQKEWLQSALQGSDACFKIVYFHHAPYSSGTEHGSTEGMRWPFSAWGADAVLSGHEHIYEQLEVDGIPYFINGLGGDSRYSIKDPPLPESKVRYKDTFGAMHVSANTDGMIFLFVTKDNDLIDTYLLPKDCSGKDVTVLPPITAPAEEVVAGLPTQPAPSPPAGRILSAIAQEIANCPRCKEIDDVWMRIRAALRLTGDPGTKIWHKGWKRYEEVYPSALTLGVGKNDYDSYILEAFGKYDVDAALIKAIIQHESGFNPNVISITGCAGLMQVCGDSINAEYIQTTPGNCCRKEESGESEFEPCRNERQRCGSDVWCPAGNYVCSPSNDDRFNPRLNILSGTSEVKGKINKVGNCGTDQVKAWIAAYNIGQVPIKKAVEDNGNNCNSWEDVWNVLKQNTDTQRNTIYNVEKKFDVGVRLNNLRGTPQDYVGKVYNSYLQYRQQMAGVS